MRRVVQLVMVLLAGLLVWQAVYSLRWPIAHDEAPLFYESFLIQHYEKIPYRDIFDFQMPGSMALYSVIGGLARYNAVAIRVIDLLILAFILVVTFLSLKKFGGIPAFTACVLFGLKYLQGGPSMSLQREYLLLVFLAPAVWIALQDSRNVRRRLLLGFLFGAMVLIKPHAAIGLLPVVLFGLTDLIRRQKKDLRELIAAIFPYAAGFLLPLLTAFAWLAANQALAPFMDIAMHYWPLYSQINGEMMVTSDAERFLFILDQVWKLGGHGLWFVPAILSVYLLHDLKAYLLASLVLCYAVYPAFSGQFFPYHYIPLLYFVIVLAALSLKDVTFSRPWIGYAAVVLLGSVVLWNVRPSTAFMRQLEGRRVATSSDRAEEISEFLADNLNPGDTVQPLDWTGGALLAALEARAPIATSYVFDFYFYHHVSNPYIKNLRADFMNQLQAAPPRFVIEVIAADKPWVGGEDTTRDFPELRDFLSNHYSVTIQSDDYLIHEIK